MTVSLCDDVRTFLRHYRAQFAQNLSKWKASRRKVVELQAQHRQFKDNSLCPDKTTHMQLISLTMGTSWPKHVAGYEHNGDKPPWG